MGKKICAITSTRADFGLLKYLLKEIDSDSSLDLSLIATGTHFLPEFGNTYQEIDASGLKITEKIDLELKDNTANGVVKSMAIGLQKFGEALKKINPDLLILLGDRYEIFTAAQAATILKIPIAHLYGGDSTQGAMDEVFRHSITKMAHLHFTSNQASANRVIQMGENSQHVYNFGCLSLETIKNTKLLDKKALEKELSFNFQEKNFLITFHPETLSKIPAKEQLQNLLSALDGFNHGMIFTAPNADPEGQSLVPLIESFVSKNKNAVFTKSLGSQRYLSALKECDIVIGNSSSGIYDAPAMKTATVNIGDRQKGRLSADSVIHCKNETNSIKEAINKALEMKLDDHIVNPYDQGSSPSKKITETLRNFSGSFSDLLQKEFKEQS